MSQVRSLIDRYFSVTDGELVIGGVPATKLASEYGTPLFVYDQGVWEGKWDRLRGTLPAEVSIFYSVKANPAQAALRYFLSRGAGLEIASAGEYHQAVAAGCPPERILFAGPGKTDEELELVLSAGIAEIHVESPNEARRIAEIAARLGRKVPVALRVNPSGEAEGGAMRMGGRPAPFGVDEEDVDAVLDLILSSFPALDFRGIHLFSGTQILDAEILETQYRKAIAIAGRIAARLGHPLRTVDFGGGLGIPYFAHEEELDMEALRKRLDGLWQELKNNPLFTGTNFVVEPGRYLVGEAGVYITRVTDVKVSRGKRFIITDGGMNHHLAASGNLGQTIKRNYPVAVLNRLDDSEAGPADVVGPLCTPLDVLARGLSLSCTKPGDLIGVFQSGAYGRSASPLHFLSHRTPGEVRVHDGVASLMRRRGEAGDTLRDQCMAATSG